MRKLVTVVFVAAGLAHALVACVSDDNGAPPSVDASFPVLDSGVSALDAAQPASDAGHDATVADASDAGATTDANGDANGGGNTDAASDADAGAIVLANVLAISGPGETANLANTSFCALLAGGAVSCWGSNGYGQLGLGTAGAPASAVYATPIPGVSGATAIAVGDDHVCALTTSGDAGVPQTLCWGDNTNGALGTGGDAGVQGPVIVSSVAGAETIASGGGASCATVSTEVYCWGANVYGNVCDDSSGVQTTPYFVGLSADQVALGLHGLGLSSGRVFSWGRDDYGQLGRTAPQQCTGANTPCDQNYARSAIGSDAGFVAVGGFHSCAIVSGQAQCFGDDRSGQLGDGKTTTSPVQTPVTVQGLAGAPVQLALGWQFTCALLADGTVQCWGDDTSGASGVLDAGPGGLALSPVTVLTGAKAISAGDYTACALMNDGTVECWGRNAEGELGNGTTDALAHGPTKVLTRSF